MRGTVDSYSSKSGKRWRIRWDLPPDPETGERRRGQRRGFATKREASQALREELRRVDRGSYVAPDQLTVKE
ncbi:MAG: Arm DNA-binding domain-containing protein [Nitriliruptorales bacterium]|nr:Arm DNA-binding domain-containing protein [Nitriliruptorales bacterium]